MSEPDAVPLPREGEVFFDVRGEARSMRLSWYADSKVAVFSIWQANRCTGTFRLPFADLARMVQTLQSGPRPYQEPRSVPEYGAQQGSGAGPAAWNGTAAAATHAYAASPVYPQAGGPPPDYALVDYDPPDYQDAPRYAEGYSAAGYAGPGGPERDGGSRAGYDRPAYERPGHERTGHERTGYERTGDYRTPHLNGFGDHGPRHAEPGYESTEHDLPSFPSVPARTGQSAADWASTEWGAATAAYPGS